MGNAIVSISINNAVVELNIPSELIKKMECLGMHFSHDIYAGARINVWYINDIYYRFSVEYSRKIVEDTLVNADQILFRIFVEAEDLLMRQMLERDNCSIALHGGGVVVNGRAILVLQEKGSGKSTLIAKLTQNKSYKYLSDDLVVCNGNNICGLPLPIRLRQLMVDGLDLTADRTERGLDIDMKTRYFYQPSNISELSAAPVSVILIPHYDSNNANSLVRAEGYEKTHIIFNQIKKYPNIKQLYNNVLQLANSVNIYHLYYKDFSVIDLLEKEDNMATVAK